MILSSLGPEPMPGKHPYGPSKSGGSCSWQSDFLLSLSVCYEIRKTHVDVAYLNYSDVPDSINSQTQTPYVCKHTTWNNLLSI